MSDGTSKLREWATADREQADALDYFSGLGGDSPRSSQVGVQADDLRATADGWEAIADESDDGVDDPDQHDQS